VAVLVVQVDPRFTWLAVPHHRRERATTHTELAARVIDVTQYPLRAAVTQDLLGGEPGDALSATVPVRDVPVPGDEVHTIGDLVEQAFVELLVHVGPPRSVRFAYSLHTHLTIGCQYQ